MINKLNSWIKNFFGFSATETNGFVLLLFLLFLSIFTPAIVNNLLVQKPVLLNKNTKLLDSLTSVIESKIAQQEEYLTESGKSPVELFPFNPNTASLLHFMRLGLPEFIAKRIIKYRNNGGRFRIKSDLIKIYGFTDNDYKRLENYINLPTKMPYLVEKKKEAAKATIEKVKPIEDVKLDINLADTIFLQEIKGVGSILSNRIIKFRDKLGGFVSLEQLDEVFGLPSEVAIQIKAKFYVENGFKPNQLNINLADSETFKAHPYISWKIGEAIVNYRKLHGKYETIDQLKSIHLISNETFQNLKPYLSL